MAALGNVQLKHVDTKDSRNGIQTSLVPMMRRCGKTDFLHSTKQHLASVLTVQVKDRDIRRSAMSMATGTHRLDTSGAIGSKRWRLASYVFLIALIALAIYAQNQPPEISIQPTSPLPAVNIP
jgi:hypothetical protein